MTARAGLRSLSLVLPSMLRTNAYWQRHHPQLVATAADKVLERMWKLQGVVPADPFDEEMAPFLADPFQGAVSRRWLAPDETVLAMELAAARRALDAARLSPEDVDLCLSASFLPDTVGVGSAAFLARDLALRCPAWNLETACSSALVALETAAAFIETGRHRHVLCVISCSYSRAVDETGSLAFAVGDGASAFVIGPTAADEGILGVHTMNSAGSCGAMSYELVQADAGPQVRLRAGKTSNTAIRDTAERLLPACCEGAARAGGAALADVDFLATTTPIAWYAAWARRVLHLAPEQTFNGHPLNANCGPVSMLLNLFTSARQGLVRPGDLVLLHTVGVVSNASAALVRWGDVALAPDPDPPASGE